MRRKILLALWPNIEYILIRQLCLWGEAMFQHVKEHENKKVQLLRDTIDNPFTWPGGYDLVLLMSDGQPLCVSCGKKEYAQIKEATINEDHSGWALARVFINYEDEMCFCCRCNERLPAEYE